MALLRLTVEDILLAILVLQCSAALCANRSGGMCTLTYVGLQIMMEFVVGAQVFNTSMTLIATKERT